MSPTVPLLRARLEVDRALRQRAFFARALAGSLSRWEYAELVRQLGALADVVDPCGEAALAAGADGATLTGSADGPERSAGAADACLAARILAPAAGVFARELGPEAADVGMAVLGTSWAQEAEERLEARFPGATALLSLLVARGASGVARVERRLRASRRDPRAVYVFAEVVRGALLGLAAQLESTWPPPVAALVPTPMLGGT